MVAFFCQDMNKKEMNFLSSLSAKRRAKAGSSPELSLPQCEIVFLLHNKLPVIKKQCAFYNALLFYRIIMLNFLHTVNCYAAILWLWCLRYLLCYHHKQLFIDIAAGLICIVNTVIRVVTVSNQMIVYI